MAREYGKILMSAWTDQEFTSLTRRAQGTFMFLISQADLNRAGVITMALNRWSTRSAENDRRMVLDDLAELARGGFVVVDEAQEELLVRSYIRNDDGWKSPNIMVAVASAARQISSETLRSVIADEIAKIDTAGLSTAVNTKTQRSTKEFIEMVIAEALPGLQLCVKDPDVIAWGTLQQRVTGRVPKSPESERVTERVSRGFLTTTTPETTTSTTPETTTSPPTIVGTDEDFEAFWDAYDKKHGKKTARAKWQAALKKPGVTPDLLIRAATEYVAWLKSEGKHPTFAKDPSTWLNGEHWNDERTTRRHVQTSTSTTDERVRSTLALAQRLRDQEQDHTPTQRAIGQTR